MYSFVHALILSLSTTSVSSPLFSPNLLYGGSKQENKVLLSIRASKDGHPPLNRLVQPLFKGPSLRKVSPLHFHSTRESLSFGRRRCCAPPVSLSVRHSQQKQNTTAAVVRFEEDREEEEEGFSRRRGGLLLLSVSSPLKEVKFPVVPLPPVQAFP